MLLDRRVFFVKERVSFLRLTDRYDIYDPETGEQIGFAKEELSAWMMVLRVLFRNMKSMFPTTVVIKEDETSAPVLTLHRHFAVVHARVDVIDQQQKVVGFFRSKAILFGFGFGIYRLDGEQIADVKGDWKGWDFKLTDMHGNELGTVNKKWAGALKEFFTSADNYVISLDESLEQNRALAALLLAASLAIDIVYKEAE